MFSNDIEDGDLIVLNIEDTNIKCDRKKLMQYSPYFEAMFNGNFTEKDKKTITLKGVKKNGIKNILNLIDKRVDYIPSDDIYDVLVDACMLQFDFVKQYCIKNLEGNINEDTCLRIWQVAEQLDIKDLASKAKCKALMDFNDVRHTRGLLLLNIKELHSYLSNTMLHCNCEMDVFEAGIRWWYDHCNRNVQMELCNQEEITKYQTKHLLVILRCLDYTVMMISDIDNIFLLCLDISENIFTRNVLNSVAKLISGTQVSDQTLEDRTAVELYHNCRPRQLSYLPCIVCQEFNDNYNKRKRTKYSSCNCVNTINLYFYDSRLESMAKLADLCMHNEYRCNALLEGYQMVPYKENLLFFGGEYKYGTADWNMSVWMYNTFREDWRLLTKLPKERRHFKSIVIKDKLYVIGGTGKYRIIQDDMMVYDLIVDCWEPPIGLPHSLYSIKCCNFRDNLFVISGNLANGFGFLYSSPYKTWQRIDIDAVPGDMGDFIMFSYNEALFFKGTWLVELSLSECRLRVRRTERSGDAAATPDTLGHCRTDSQLYLFSEHSCRPDPGCVYLLQTCDLRTRATRTLLQLNDSQDTTWNINSGCFAFFHHSIVKDSKPVLDFIF